MTDNAMLQAATQEDLKRSLALVNELHVKMRKLVEDFSTGAINRTQFHSLYDRYQSQLDRIMQLTQLTDDPAALSALSNMTAEETIVIKKRLTARLLGVSIYNNRSGMPIETIGEFSIDPSLLVPMLSSYRAATREIFKAGMRSTTMENGQWLWFVPGNHTTLIGLFSFEPSGFQLNTLERMHRDFEDANKVALERGSVDPSTLAIPFMTFVSKVHKEQHTSRNPKM